MPIYECTSPTGLVDDSTKENIAKEITRIHCDATGSPASFVNVLFHETHEGSYFVGGRPSGHSIVVGTIRQGRDIETRQAILSDLSHMWTRLTGQPAGELVIALSEIPGETVMEGGILLSRPGQEQGWVDANRARFAEGGMT
jgi:phenylpyruvate tautomerase PptA (4-oxalocrotonate tautomerase family)